MGFFKLQKNFTWHDECPTITLPSQPLSKCPDIKGISGTNVSNFIFYD